MELVLSLKVKFLFIILFVYKTSSEITDTHRCADLQCQEPIATGTTVQQYFSPKNDILSFKSNLPVIIYSRVGENLFVELSGKRGYVPKRFIKELDVLVSEAQLVDVPNKMNTANLSQNVPPSAQEAVPPNGGQVDVESPAVEQVVPVRTSPEDHRPGGEQGNGAVGSETKERPVAGDQGGGEQSQPDPGGTAPFHKDVQPSFSSSYLQSTFSDQFSKPSDQSHFSDINAPNLPSMKSTKHLEDPEATPVDRTFTSDGKAFIVVDGTTFPAEDEEPAAPSPVLPSSTQAPEESYTTLAASTQTVESLTDSTLQKGNEVDNNSPTDTELNIAPSSALSLTNTHTETMNSQNLDSDPSLSIHKEISTDGSSLAQNELTKSAEEDAEAKEQVKDDDKTAEKVESEAQQEEGGSWIGGMKNFVSDVINTLDTAIKESNTIPGDDDSVSEKGEGAVHVAENIAPHSETQKDEPGSDVNKKITEETGSLPPTTYVEERQIPVKMESEQRTSNEELKDSSVNAGDSKGTVSDPTMEGNRHNLESGTPNHLDTSTENSKLSSETAVTKSTDDSEDKKSGDDSEDGKSEDVVKDNKSTDESAVRNSSSNSEVKKPADDVEIRKPADDAEVEKPADDAEVQKLADDAGASKPADDSEFIKSADDVASVNDSEDKKPTGGAEDKKLPDDFKSQETRSELLGQEEQKSTVRPVVEEPAGNEEKVDNLVDKNTDSHLTNVDSIAADQTASVEAQGPGSAPDSVNSKSADQRLNDESPNKGNTLEGSSSGSPELISHLENTSNPSHESGNPVDPPPDPAPNNDHKLQHVMSNHNQHTEINSGELGGGDRVPENTQSSTLNEPNLGTADASSEEINNSGRNEQEALSEAKLHGTDTRGHSTTSFGHSDTESNPTVQTPEAIAPPSEASSATPVTTESGQEEPAGNAHNDLTQSQTDLGDESVTQDPGLEEPASVEKSEHTTTERHLLHNNNSGEDENEDGGEEEGEEDEEENPGSEDKGVDDDENARVSESVQYETHEVSPPEFQDDKDYAESNDGEEPDKTLLPEGPNYFDTLRAILETVIHLVPDPLNSALVDLSLKGVSPRVVVFTAFTGLLTLILISTGMIIQRGSKENFLKGKLCVSEGKLFKLNTENQVMREELQVTRNEMCIVKKSLEDAQDAVLPLQDQLSISQSQSSKLQACIQDMQDKMAAQQEAVDSLRTNLVRKEQEITAECAERQKAEETVDSLQLKLLQTENQLQETQDEVFKLSQQCTELHMQKQEVEQAVERQALQTRTMEERLEEVRVQLEQVQETRRETQELLSNREEEVQALTAALRLVEPIKQNSEAEEYEETIKALLDISKVTVRLEKAEDTKNNLESQLKTESEKSSTWEAKYLETRERCNTLEQSKQSLTQEKVKAQTELEVLANYFKDKETRMQKELGAQEAWRQQKEESATSADRKAADLQKETDLLRSQIKTLKEELENTERGFKTQVAGQEKKAHENWLAARAAERKTEDSKQEAATLRQRLILVERELEVAKSTSDNIIRPIPKRPPGANGETSFVDEPLLETSTISLMSAGNKSEELDQTKRLVPPFPPMPMPPLGMPLPPPPLGMPLPPPPFPPPPLFGPPPPFMPHPFEDPHFGPPPDPWKMGPPPLHSGGRRSQPASRGPPSPPYSSRNASRQSSPPPPRRIEELPDRPQRTFSPGSSSSGRDYRDTDSPSLDHPPPRLYDLPPPRGGYRRPPSPHYMDRMPPPLSMGSHRTDSSISHLYTDTPPDMRRGGSEMTTSSPRTRRSASPSSSKGGPAAVV